MRRMPLEAGMRTTWKGNYKNTAESGVRAGGRLCLPRLTCLVTQANEQQLDSSQLTLAIRLRPREMKRVETRT